MEVVNDSRRILLLSSSTIFGSEYLDHAEDEIHDFLGKITRVLFIPFALHDRDAYAAKARARFARLGYQLDSLHEASDMHAGLKTAKTLYDFDLLKAIRARVESGTPYIGSSAGSNVAGPTIKTTNDMPIVEPPSFAALGLVAFQINPHYVDPEPESTHMGETREERILQFLEENETPVIGLREGAMVRFENGRAELKGVSGARIFRKSRQSIEVELGTEIEALLEGRKFR